MGMHFWATTRRTENPYSRRARARPKGRIVDDYKLVGKAQAEKLTNAVNIMAQAGVVNSLSQAVLENIAAIGYSKRLNGKQPQRLAGVLKIVKEKSSCETGKFLQSPEKKMGFKISIIRADNGTEFVNYEDRTDKSGRFRKVAESLGMRIRRTRPYSPWQNGKAERSHREDGKILYGRKVFTNETELKKQVRKHENRYNRTAKTSLDFKSPDRVAG